MASTKQPAPQEKFSMEYNGKTYHAEYYVEGWMMTIKAMNKDSAPVDLSGQMTDPSNPPFLARVLLRELIDGGWLG
jgi:hypothetical protein